MRKKIGIITFHNSYNCGSMLESYAMQTVINRLVGDAEIINFSNEGQRRLYSVFFNNHLVKDLIKNILIFPHKKQIELNNEKYENFKRKNFVLSKPYKKLDELSDDGYRIIVAGSDQIWNITIADGDDAYFLPWAKKAKKVAYAPSFGAKSIQKYADDPEKYKKMLNDFDALSIRENNGKRWIKELCSKDVPVLLDPTLLLERGDYEVLENKDVSVDGKYIFFYSPSFNRNICKFVKKLADMYNLKVITWSTKSYHLKFIRSFGFELPEYEDPSVYLSLIKNAELVLTTSYHGTIFSTIYRKKFFCLKNGGMYGDDDRVITLLKQLDMMDRLIEYEYDVNYGYFKEVDYEKYREALLPLKKKSMDYLRKNLIG